MKMSDGGTRIFRPCRSAGVVIGAARVVEAARAGVVDREPDQLALLEAAQHCPARPRRRARGACARPSRTRTAATSTRVSGNGLFSDAEVDARDVERAEARQVDRVGLAAELARVVDADASSRPSGFAVRACSPIQRTASTVGIAVDVHVGGGEHARASLRANACDTRARRAHRCRRESRGASTAHAALTRRVGRGRPRHARAAQHFAAAFEDVARLLPGDECRGRR